MSTTTLIILLSIGVSAGILSGFVGVGGGIIIVPALMMFLGLSQYEASGTSLFVLMMPVVALSVYNYWKAGTVNWKYGLIIAGAFVIGGFVGSKMALKLNPSIIKIVFGVLMLYIAYKMISSGYHALQNEK